MPRILPKVGTTLRPYDSWRRYRATVVGYAKAPTGEKLIKIKSLGTGNISRATLRHLTRTFRAW